MPFYRCQVPPNALSLDQRQELARAIADTHCGITNAPRKFVQVVFEEEPADPQPAPFFINGYNRAGRPPETRDEILAGLREAFARVAGVPLDDVSGRIVEGQASWTMEGGQILPEPGEEGPEWYEEHATAAS